MDTEIARPDVYLRKKGIKASYQRISIYEYLRHSTEHPSVSQIFDDLYPVIPSLSRATVYNTINLFVDRKIVIPVHVEGSEARYDMAEPQHAHFHCVSCQRIYDIPIHSLEPPEGLKGFEVQEAQVHFKGLCPECR